MCWWPLESWGDLEQGVPSWPCEALYEPLVFARMQSWPCKNTALQIGSHMRPVRDPGGSRGSLPRPVCGAPTLLPRHSHFPGSHRLCCSLGTRPV